MKPNSTFADSFLVEAQDLLAQVEDLVLEIEQRPQDTDLLNRLFRVFHTLKGSGSMFGFEEMAAFTHHVETVLDRVRSGALGISRPLVDLVLMARDHIKQMLDSEAASDTEEAERIVSRLRGLSVSEPASPTTEANAPSQVEPGSSAPFTYSIHFRPHRGIFSSGLDPLSLIRELQALGECEIKTDTSEIPALDKLAPESCYLAWTINLTTEASLNAIKDVFVFVEDESDLDIKKVAPSKDLPGETPTARPGAIEEGMNLGALNESSSAMPEARAAVGDKTSASMARKAPPANDTVRVASDRLDRLVNLVGELVINHSRFSQLSTRHVVPELGATTEELERLVTDLRDIVLGIRMMPIGATFNRFRRLVRDLSSELGKEMDLVLEGEETELDKTVIDQLSDPLVHLIRNSIDHGIETPEEREAAGKPRRGTIRLKASHEGPNVLIVIQDDGKGLDLEAIQAKAIERQLITPDARLSQNEIFGLIFLPGFSTAKKVTSVSGRGVGMDVVKRQIDALRGNVVISSERGTGTTISLTLPLTLAIIDGLLVEIGSDRFVVPMSVVSENVEIHRSARSLKNGRNVVAIRGELVPYVRLRDAFAIDGPELDLEKIVIARHGSDRVGLVVDRVLGNHQTVIQSLGKFYRNIGLVSGATIMGDGRVALILDLGGVVRAADARGNGSSPSTAGHAASRTHFNQE